MVLDFILSGHFVEWKKIEDGLHKRRCKENLANSFIDITKPLQMDLGAIYKWKIFSQIDMVDQSSRLSRMNDMKESFLEALEC